MKSRATGGQFAGRGVVMLGIQRTPRTHGKQVSLTLLALTLLRHKTKWAFRQKQANQRQRMKPADCPEHEQGDPPRRAAMNSALRRVGCVVSSAAMALAMLGSIGLADLVGAVSMSIVSSDREFDRNWIVGTTGIALCHVLVFFSSRRIAPVITVGVLIVAMASAFASGVEPLSITATPLIVLLCSCGALAVIVCVMEFVAERRASQILRVITAWVGVALLAGVTFTVCDEVLRKTVRADGGSATISASPGRVVIYCLAVAILFALAHQRLRRQPAHSQAGRVQ